MLPNHHLKKTTALALALGAIAPAAATAKPIGADPTPFTTHMTPIVRITTPVSGFDWGDAGIGAAGGLALAMLGVGGGLVISHHRPRRTRPTTGLPS